MVRNLTDEKRKWNLKQYWKTDNCECVSNQWRESCIMPPPTRVTIYPVRDKFDRTGSVHNAQKAGQLTTVSTPKNAFEVAQAFTQSPEK
ncbi:hypothetical protein BsWGS_25200 [Bradybaena similaris]